MVPFPKTPQFLLEDTAKLIAELVRKAPGDEVQPTAERR